MPLNTTKEDLQRLNSDLQLIAKNWGKPYLSNVWRAYATRGQLRQDEIIAEVAAAVAEEASQTELPTPEATSAVIELLNAAVADFGAQAVADAINSITADNIVVTPEDIIPALEEVAALEPAMDAPAALSDEQQRSINQRIKQLEQENRTMKLTVLGQPAAPPTRGSAVDYQELGGVVDRKYGHLTPQQMAFGFIIAQTAARANMVVARPTEDYVRAMVNKISNIIGDSHDYNYRSTRNALRDMGIVRFSPEQFQRAIMRDLASGEWVRANELTSETNNSTWVGAFYSNMLWEKIRTRRIYEVLIAAGMQEVEIPQGSKTFNILAEGADPTVYYATESVSASAAAGLPTAIAPITTPAAALKTITPSKLSERVMLTGELEEDWIISAVPELTLMMDNAMAAAVENVLVLGDTEAGATGNINSDDAAPSATAKFMAMNGFKKNALVTNVANARDGGTLAADDYSLTRKLMGVNGLNPKQVVYLVDMDTYYTTLPLSEVKTLEVFGNGATILTGELETIWGSPLLPSDQMTLTAADGKYTTTDPTTNNTKGQIVAVAAPRWKVGWKRRATSEVQRWSGADVNEFVIHLRFGLVPADSDGAAISYNLTV